MCSSSRARASAADGRPASRGAAPPCHQRLEPRPGGAQVPGDLVPGFVFGEGAQGQRDGPGLGRLLPRSAGPGGRGPVGYAPAVRSLQPGAPVRPVDPLHPLPPVLQSSGAAAGRLPSCSAVTDVLAARIPRRYSWNRSCRRRRRGERFFAAAEIRDHVVEAGEGEDAQDRGGGDDQAELTVFGLGLLVRADQGVNSGRVAERVWLMSTTSVPGLPAAASSSTPRSLAALVMSTSSGVTTTGSPLIISTGNPASGIRVCLPSSCRLIMSRAMSSRAGSLPTRAPITARRPLPGTAAPSPPGRAGPALRRSPRPGRSIRPSV